MKKVTIILSEREARVVAACLEAMRKNGAIAWDTIEIAASAYRAVLANIEPLAQQQPPEQENVGTGKTDK